MAGRTAPKAAFSGVTFLGLFCDGSLSWIVKSRILHISHVYLSKLRKCFLILPEYFKEFKGPSWLATPILRPNAAPLHRTLLLFTDRQGYHLHCHILTSDIFFFERRKVSRADWTTAPGRRTSRSCGCQTTSCCRMGWPGMRARASSIWQTPAVAQLRPLRPMQTVRKFLQ